MQITEYFSGPTQPIPKDPSISPFTILENKLKTILTLTVIDINQYVEMVNILKTKGLLSNAHIYLKFVNILKVHTHADIPPILDLFQTQFSHIHYIIQDNKINKQFLLQDMQTHGPSFTLTPDQQDAVCDITQFIYDPLSTRHGLCGLPGTGKTILITKLIHYLIAHKYIKSIVFVASTNKAVNVIKGKFRADLDNLFQHITKKFDIPESNTLDDVLDELETYDIKIHFLTIHKLLGYRNNYDSDGERIFVRGQNMAITKYELVIIDEISMINFSMVYNLFDPKITKNTKILFIGDEGQLTPVHEAISIIFGKDESDFDKSLFDDAFIGNSKMNRDLLKDEMESKFQWFKTQILSLKYSCLNTVMRTNNNSVIMLCNELRKKIFDSEYVPQFFKCKSDKVHFYKYSPVKGKMDSLWFKKYISYMKSSTDKCNSLILTWTNKQTNEYNNNMRKLLFQKEVLDKFEIGDILVLADFYNLKEKNKKCDRFYSSEQIKVIEIEHITKVIPAFVENLSIQKKIDGILDIKEKYVKIMKAINKATNRNYNVWKLHVTKLSPILPPVPEIHHIFVLSDSSISQHELDKKIVADKITELSNYYKGAHKEHYSTIDELIIRKVWKEFNNKFIDIFAKVNMSYSMTTHKSQGSTFHNVFVDMVDILKNELRTDANRCLYTAFSRTANEVHILYQ